MDPICVKIARSSFLARITDLSAVASCMATQVSHDGETVTSPRITAKVVATIKAGSTEWLFRLTDSFFLDRGAASLTAYNGFFSAENR